MCNDWRSRGTKIVVTNGCYDLLHRGHVAFLEQAVTLGDVLVVAVNGDKAVKELKGESRPIIDEWARAATVASLHCVDAVVIVDSVRVNGFLAACGQVLWVKGGDYTIDTLDKSEVEAVNKNEGSIRILPLFPGYSTSSLVNRIKNTQ